MLNAKKCYWSDQSPHWMQEYHIQCPQMNNVAADIKIMQNMGPYILTNTKYPNRHQFRSHDQISIK